jgi:hypothetical protein
VVRAAILAGGCDWFIGELVQGVEIGVGRLAGTSHHEYPGCIVTVRLAFIRPPANFERDSLAGEVDISSARGGAATSARSDSLFHPGHQARQPAGASAQVTSGTVLTQEWDSPGTSRVIQRSTGDALPCGHSVLKYSIVEERCIPHSALSIENKRIAKPCQTLVAYLPPFTTQARHYNVRGHRHFAEMTTDMGG